MPEAATAPAPAPAVAAPKPASTVPMINLSSQPSSTPTTPQPEEKSMFDKIDEKAGVKKAPPAKEPAKEKTPEPPKDKPEETKVEAKKDEEKPAEQKTDKNTPEQKPGEPKPSAWKLYRDLEKEHKALKAEYEQIKTTSPKPTEHPDFKKVSEERDNLAKQLAELSDEIKYVNYERSPEYQQQYDAPYKQAVTDSIAAISEFQVTNPDGSVRPATDADFWEIARAPGYQQAKAKANELFGDPTDAATVLQLRTKVLEAHKRAEHAKQEYRTKGNERDKQLNEQRTKQAQADREAWENLNKEAEKKYPDLFAEKEGDTKWNELRSKGFERAKAAFEGKGTPALNSAIYMKAGAFDAVKYERDTLRTQLKEAEAKIAEYEGSEPTTGEPEAGIQTPKEKSFADLVDAAAAKNR